MPDLRIVGVCRAGLENVNLKEATEKGIIVFNVMGRNAEAVSDFAVGMIIAEARNIARAHFAIKNGNGEKTFVNSDNVLQLKGKRIGLVGFGYIGQLVAKKLSGFDVEVAVFDPWLDKEKAEKLGVISVDKETLFKTADFVSIHARLTEENKHMIGKKELELMKTVIIPHQYRKSRTCGFLTHLLMFLKRKKLQVLHLMYFLQNLWKLTTRLQHLIT